MQHESLFGHLAGMLSSHPENVATEALKYVLERSSVAKRAFLQYAARANVELAETLFFRTQASGEDNAVPDLAGTDSESRQVLLIEAKFWAGLTGNQPVTYLKRLPDEVDGLLLFVAPAKRLDTLWAELLRRCQDENGTVEQPYYDTAEHFRSIKIGTTHTLALTSWRALLVYILRALETEGEYRAASDVQQLQGLCERMDSEAFLPLRSEELTSDTGTRVRQYCEIVNEATRQAVAAGIASIGGFKATGGAAWYGRYMSIHGVLNFLHFSADSWSRRRATPLWLRVGSSRESKHPLKEALANLELEQPSRLIIDDNHLLVPIHMPIGVEKPEVVSAVFEQVKEVADLLRAYKQPEQIEADPKT